ncbi:FtsB family cell division protein [Qipengyuania thermophila]|uniref:FtsB family cell division protein n=1 Tax=Qipengyuania thermophila TaxID=2509361 RepID=UPI001F1BE681|nr:septum formation initiator family protein [Qipengyuania thermophila]
MSVASLVTASVLLGLIVAGPSGLIAWSEYAQLKEKREAELAALIERRDRLRQRVILLNPDNADPDLVGELIRRNLNVVHPDEMILSLDEEQR